jgi:hypothetical protein
MRGPQIEPGSYVTTPRPVRTPFISSWNVTMIAYAAQKTFLVTIRVR